MASKSRSTWKRGSNGPSVETGNPMALPSLATVWRYLRAEYISRLTDEASSIWV
ncbi:MAG: hypothetical protein BWY71_01454 [Planctomycetes bacterium ADurb.Bin412]|nr:MAG: hypothetical protein BWY71_01454 [Planctomycetes bacterium ADurb.Bin412]